MEGPLIYTRNRTYPDTLRDDTRYSLSHLKRSYAPVESLLMTRYSRRRRKNYIRPRTYPSFSGEKLPKIGNFPLTNLSRFSTLI